MERSDPRTTPAVLDRMAREIAAVNRIWEK